MLRSLKDMEHYTIHATDGDIGDVVDFLVDDEHWTMRYLVAKTGGFFDERRVLVSPISFGSVDWASRRFHLALTREKVRKSPGIDLEKPVSRQHELDFARYYGYPYYWGYAGAWGMGGYPGLLANGVWNTPLPTFPQRPADVHLRSIEEVCGYHVEGTDGPIGHIQDFIVDDATWTICYLVVDTSNWLFGKRVLIAPRWAKGVSWEQRRVHVELSRAQIKNSPAWDPEAPVNRQYEERLYDYYGRPAYWAGGEPWSGSSAPHDEATRPG